MTAPSYDEFCFVAGSVSRETFEGVVAFEKVFRKWAARFNLVAPSTLDDLWRRHILDSAQLARAYEELNERPAAVREYCRFLALAPQATDAADVRARIAALSASPAGTTSVADQAASAAVVGILKLLPPANEAIN